MDVFELLEAERKKAAERFDQPDPWELLGSKANMKRTAVISFILLFSSGCVVVGGYSGDRGWFVWPGTFLIFLVVAVWFLIFRKRK